MSGGAIFLYCLIGILWGIPLLLAIVLMVYLKVSERNLVPSQRSLTSKSALRLVKYTVLMGIVGFIAAARQLFKARVDQLPAAAKENLDASSKVVCNSPVRVVGKYSSEITCRNDEEEELGGCDAVATSPVLIRIDSCPPDMQKAVVDLLDQLDQGNSTCCDKTSSV
mmetsp:Transcript_15323/g.24952  ORF Transcript_15323/g.24952 Transcript_15323/m.24952 type:complete len:167 (+) Transcript_15323:1412-1912(+)